MGFKRISVKCLFCGRNQTHYSRVGLWFKCTNKKCGKRNPGPAMTAAAFLPEEEAPEPVPNNPKPKAAKTVHTVSRPAAPAAKKPAAKAPARKAAPPQPPAPKARAPRPAKRTQGASVTAARQQAAPPPAKKSGGFMEGLDRVLYGG